MEKTALDLELLINLDKNDLCLQDFLDRLKSLKGVEHAHFVTKETRKFVCFHFDPNILPLSRIERVAYQAGVEFSDRFKHEQIAVTDLNSADAAETLAEQIRSLKGIVHANVNYAAGLVSVAYDSELINAAKIRDLIQKRVIGRVDRHPGHDHHSHSYLPHWLQQRWTMVLVVLAGLFLAAGAVGSFTGFIPPWLVLVCYWLSYLFGGYDIASHAIPGLFRGKFDTDILMLAAAAGAAVLGEWGEGAFLLFLFAIGHAGEHYALDKARNAVNALADLMPTQALKKEGDDWVMVNVNSLKLGDQVKIRAGDRVAVDGKVLEGTSHLDQSAITGESKTVRKTLGDSVYAGSINQQAVLTVEVERLAEDSTLGRIMRMVAEAQSQQSPTQQITQRFTRVFVPCVLIAVVLMTFVPPLFGLMTLEASFYRAMLLLVASSPCALAIGTPAAMLSGIAQAAKNGVLIKGGAHLENLGRLRAIAFDKTGTLTQGRFSLVHSESFGNVTEDTLLQTAASLEVQSNHPLATALVQATRDKGLDVQAANAVENHAGQGISGDYQGREIRVGKPQWFALDDAQQQQVEALSAKGLSVAVVERNKECIGLLGFGDQIRQEAVDMLATLGSHDIDHRVMLTGDNAQVAEEVAGQLGITEVKADLLPEDKLEAINQLKQSYSRVAMVGDGVNDAPALAQATVGIAMGGAGTDVALETADVVLMADDLVQIPFAVRLSQFARRIVKQNLCIALGVIALLICTSVLGLVDLSFTVILHEGSTLVVVLNALRLLKFS